MSSVVRIPIQEGEGGALVVALPGAAQVTLSADGRPVVTLSTDVVGHVVVAFHDGRTWLPVRPSSASRARWTFEGRERRVWEEE